MTPRELFDIVEPCYQKLPGVTQHLEFVPSVGLEGLAHWHDRSGWDTLRVELVAAAYVADLIDALNSRPDESLNLQPPSNCDHGGWYVGGRHTFPDGAQSDDGARFGATRLHALVTAWKSIQRGSTR